MRGWVTARSEVVDRANKSLPEVMLPNAIHDHPRDENACAVINVRHPFRQCPPLLRGISLAAFGARHGPVIRGRLAPGEHAQEAQLHQFAPGTEIFASQQKSLTW